MNVGLLKELLMIFVSALGLGLAFWCLLANKRATTNRLFFALVVLINLNIVFSYLVQQQESINFLILWLRLIWLTGSLLIPTFYFFSIHFPKKIEMNKTVNFFILGMGIMFSLLSLFSDFFIKGLVKMSWGNDYVYGPLINIFYVGLIGTIILGLSLIIKKFTTSEIIEKQRIKYFLVGATIYIFMSIIFSIFVPLLFKTIQYFYIGDYSVIFFLGFTAYAIVKHQLFNIKVIATETAVVALSIGLLIEVFISSNTTEGVLKGIIWVLATYGGYALIKSVKNEIKQKEDLEILAKKLDEANRHLEDLDEQKDNFISMASHELNTPIAAIEGYLSMIIDEKMAGQNIDKKAMGYLQNVYFSSKRLAALVRDMLNVSRIESNRIHLVNEEAQIEKIIEQAIAEIKIKADEVGHKLTFEKPKTLLPKTWLDVPRTTEVIINILGNAIKYTDPPGKIIVRAQADDGKIVVSVEDNGRGIPKDKEENVFQKFSQVEVLKDQVKGTGLGMFITKNLVELAGGKVWFKSSVDPKDHGTTFYFSLPIHKTKPADPHEGEGALFANKSTTNTKKESTTPTAEKTSATPSTQTNQIDTNTNAGADTRADTKSHADALHQ